MEQPAKQITRWPVIVGGIILVAFGGILTNDLLCAPAHRILPAEWQLLAYLGPMLLAAGAAMLLIGLGWVRAGSPTSASDSTGAKPVSEGRWKPAVVALLLVLIAVVLPLIAPMVIALGVVLLARRLWPEVRLWSKSPVLFMGLILLLISGCPWLYTPGMLGTFLFIFNGLPGLGLTLVGGALMLMRR